MKFSISEGIIEKYPDIVIAVIVVKGADNAGSSKEIEMLLDGAQSAVKSNFSLDILIKDPRISAWRKIYSDFGSKPSDYRPSIEALIRSVLNGRDIKHINKTVDLYNYISMKYVVPAGGEDLDKIEGSIHLKHAEGDEIFVPLNSDRAENPYNGEIIYCDSGKNVLCRRWNWRESDKTKLIEETKNCVIFIEGFGGEVEEAASELEQLIKHHCSAQTQIFIADKENNCIEW